MVATPISSSDIPAAALFLEKPSTVPWEVHKFGGASLATAELYKQCADLLVAESRRPLADGAASAAPTMAIVSARGGVTDKLIAVVETSKSDLPKAVQLLEAVAAEQVAVAREISSPDAAAAVERAINADVRSISATLQAFAMLKSVPTQALEVVSGYGEVWSALTMEAYLSSEGHASTWLDARDVLVVQTTGEAGLGDKGSTNTMGTDPLWEPSEAKLASWWAADARTPLRELDLAAAAPVVIVTGFVAATADGVPTTLKRSGSDYSATIFAKLMSASRITMWKNVDGVYTADPRRVPEAFPIDSLKYDEAIELAYFGAQVLHPSAMTPCIEADIPIYVRNIFNPAHPGTVITGRACSLETSSLGWAGEVKTARKQLRKAACPVPLGDNSAPIKGVTSVDSVAILNVQGTGLMPSVEMSSRLFSVLHRERVAVLMISQASADSSICLGIQESDADRALEAVRAEFFRELDATENIKISGISIEEDKSIVAVIGEGMAFRPGTGATFTKAMATAGVNIRAIAQGSSERQISLMVEREECTKALRAAHAALALSDTQVSIVVLGSLAEAGESMAGELLKLLAGTGRLAYRGSSPSALTGATAQLPTSLDGLAIDLKVTALASASASVLSNDGIDVASPNLWATASSSVGETLEGVTFAGCGYAQQGEDCLEMLTTHLLEDFNGNRIVIDATEDARVAEHYPRWLTLGAHIVSSNKLATGGPLATYRAAKNARSDANTQWLYECSGPGSGLPVISTLQDMQQTGDRIRRVEGVFSGTVNYVLESVRGGAPFSEAVAAAVAAGYAEPDPRDDLSCLDTQRKMLTLCREIGGMPDLEPEQLLVESLLPDALSGWEPDLASGKSVGEQLAEQLRPHDGAWAERVAAAEAEGGELKLIGRLDVEAGTAQLQLEVVPPTDTLARCEGMQNVIVVHSARYGAAAGGPLVLMGPAAGHELKAMGMFTDVLRLSRTLAEWNIPKIL